MARIRDVVIDCTHPASLARFWAQALDGYEIAPYDDDEIARLAGVGIHDVDDDPTVLVQPVGRGAGAGPRVWLQRVPEARAGKNRLHLDLQADDPDVDLARLEGLGARVLDRREGWVVLADPEGNELCLLH